MADFVARFLREESGAVTVDWVVLSATVLVLGALVTALIADGATDISTGVGARLSDATVPTVEFP